MSKPTKRFVYLGVREGRNAKLVNAFVELADGSENYETGDVKVWSRGKGLTFVIGQAYDIPCNDEYVATFGDAKAVEHLPPSEVTDDNLRKWSASDAAARREVQVVQAAKRAEKKYRDAWNRGLEPLRATYQSASFYEKKALLGLLHDYLEK